MTGYIARRQRDRHVWTGMPARWSPHEADARVFEFSAIAEGVTDADSGETLDAYAIEPVYVPDNFAFRSVAA